VNDFNIRVIVKARNRVRRR